MSNNPLYAPWRMDYIRSIDKPEASACFLCDAANATTLDERKSRLVLWTTEHMVVLINRYPYTSGHLMIAPRAHKSELAELTDAEQADLIRQTTRAVRVNNGNDITARAISTALARWILSSSLFVIWSHVVPCPELG